MAILWREDRRQKSWLWVGLLFFAFYFAEALLFWGPEPRFLPPSWTPLVFWGLFGVGIVWIITRPVKGGSPPNNLEKLQSWILGLGITATAVGITFLVIARTRDITLGHAALLFVLAEAAVVLGAQELNGGWLLAGLGWAAAGGWILWQPSEQDYVLGAAVAGGFVLVGLFRKCVVIR